MAVLTIRNLDDNLKHRLRMRAAAHGRSMEEETRQILRAALTSEEADDTGLADAIRARFSPFGDFDLTLPEREPVRDPPGFSDPGSAPSLDKS